MSRELKRVPLDFNWPMNKTWEGFLIPNVLRAIPCKSCNETGQNDKTRELSEDWYGFERPHKRWCHRLTQLEVDALVEKGRLRDLTHDGHQPTAKEVNEWAQEVNIMGHDAINRWIAVDARAKHLGFLGDCPRCDGEGCGWRNEKHKQDSEAWEETPIPIGEGYQMWETTSEGSPISPVFSTPEELAHWLADNKASSFGGNTASYIQWLNMIKGPGWAISAIMTDKGISSGVEHN